MTDTNRGDLDDQPKVATAREVADYFGVELPPEPVRAAAAATVGPAGRVKLGGNDAEVDEEEFAAAWAEACRRPDAKIAGRPKTNTWLVTPQEVGWLAEAARQLGLAATANELTRYSGVMGRDPISMRGPGGNFWFPPRVVPAEAAAELAAAASTDRGKVDADVLAYFSKISHEVCE